MSYKFQLPAPIQMKFTNQHPSTLSIETLPSHLHHNQPQHSHNFPKPNHFNRKMQNIVTKPSSIRTTFQNIRVQSSQKRSVSPNIRFNYIGPGNHESTRPIVSNPCYGESKVARYDEGINERKIVKTSHTMDIDTRNGHVKHGGVREKGRKITNRVYTEEDYKEVGQRRMEEKLKQINEFQIQSDKEEKDEQVKLSKEFYEEGEEDKREGGGEKDKEEEDGEEEYGNYDIENLEKVKSQRLEQSYRVSNLRIKQLEQANKRITLENDDHKLTIQQLKGELKAKKMMQQSRVAEDEKRRQGRDVDLLVRQKELQIKKLKNQIGLMKLRERQMQMQIKKLIKSSQQCNTKQINPECKATQHQSKQELSKQF